MMSSELGTTIADRFLCMDCSIDTSSRGISEFYMVHNYIWDSVTKDNPKRMLCIGCLELRLGRQLNKFDFTGAFVYGCDRSKYSLSGSRFNEKSERLLSRLMAEDSQSVQ